MITLREYLRNAQEAAARSNGLWLSVNLAIVSVLENAIRHRHSRQRVHNTLMKMAGPVQPGEPVSVESLRSAARQIANGSNHLMLI